MPYEPPKGEQDAGDECRLRFAASASLSFALGGDRARMKSPTAQAKSRRNLRALFFLASILCLLAAGGGGLILALAYAHPQVTRPLWEFGQYVMLLGLVNLAVYGGIYWQVQRLVGDSSGASIAQQTRSSEPGDGALNVNRASVPPGR